MRLVIAFSSQRIRSRYDLDFKSVVHSLVSKRERERVILHATNAMTTENAAYYLNMCTSAIVQLFMSNVQRHCK